MYPPIEPFCSGMLDVGDGNQIYYEVCGNPVGKAAVVLHGGPGSGCSATMRQYFDPSVYRIVLLDQRACGRSRPHASDRGVGLGKNTTPHLLADLEQLRRQLEVNRWLVFGVSWGATLALAYAERFPQQVSEMILASVVTTTPREIQWVTRDAGRYFPEQWERFRNGVPPGERDGDLVAAYYRLMRHPEAGVAEQAALDWCRWEDAHVRTTATSRPDPRYQDPRFRMAFARLVTHYWHHAAWLEDGSLVRNAASLSGIPAVLIHGRLDLSSPIDIPWQLSRRWTGSELVVIEDAGHGTGTSAMREAVVAATGRFAARP
jgi:proline iminopeptidase